MMTASVVVAVAENCVEVVVDDEVDVVHPKGPGFVGQVKLALVNP
jgi:hypothetical protein